MHTKTLLVIAIFSAAYSIAQPGALDPTFGVGGIVHIDLGPNGDGGQDVIALSDGNLLVCGNSRPNSEDLGFLMRLLPDGTQDPSFNTVFLDGGTQARVLRMALAADSSIYLCGLADIGSYQTFGLWHVLSDGTIDAAFGTNGLAAPQVGFNNTRAEDLVVQPDGKIVVVGHRGTTSLGDGIFMRFHPTGVLDSTFNADGIFEMSSFPNDRDQLRTVDLLSDGSIVASGDVNINNVSRSLLVKVIPSGSLDNSFSGDGVHTPTFTFPRSNGWTLAASGQQLVGAGSVQQVSTSSDVYATRYNDDGTLDQTFGNNGTTYVSPNDDDIVYDVKLAADGKIITTGYAGNTDATFAIDFLVMRYTADGMEDVTFGNGGYLITQASASPNAAFGLDVQSDGKIVCVGFSGLGNTDITVVRYCGDVSTGDADKSPSKPTLYPNPVSSHVTITLASNASTIIQVLDASGRMIQEQLVTSQDHIQLPVSALASGMYHVRVLQADKAQVLVLQVVK